MKLVNKFTLWFVIIVLVITPITMTISYYNIKKQIDFGETERLKKVNDNVAAKMNAGRAYSEFVQGQAIDITEIKGALPDEKVQVTEVKKLNADTNVNDDILTVNSFYNINGVNYKISSYSFATEPSQIFEGMINAVIWKMILLIAFIIITARIVSKYVLSPFKQTIDIINNFQLKRKEKITLPATTTQEFKELNSFLKKMTDKAVDEYIAVKEFSENASHELQTPLAVLRTKLELMTETNINETQAGLIVDMQNAIEKLTRINRSLTLLTKLENQEFEVKEHIKFCRVAKDALAYYDYLITSKNITLQTNLDKNILLKIHPTLAEILLNNLLSNAIRHNIDGGSMEVILTQKKLIVKNTGKAPEIPTEELFLRFKKSNQSADSIGLGLAIVKQICEMSGWPITYVYNNGWHVISIILDEAKNVIITKNSTETKPILQEEVL